MSIEPTRAEENSVVAAISRRTFAALFNSLFKKSVAEESVTTEEPQAVDIVIAEQRDVCCPACKKSSLHVQIYSSGVVHHSCRLARCAYLQVWSARPKVVEAIELVDPDYDPEKYKTEIEKAVAFSKQRFSGEKGLQNYLDLLQEINIEIWKACKLYSDKMNPALAYTVAHNTKNKFIQKLVKKPEGLTGVPEDAPPDVVVPLETENDQGEEFVPHVDRRPGSDEPGLQRVWVDANIDLLRDLANTWFGAKKKVALAMLKPGFTVRSVPDIPRSTVSRIRQAVLKEFQEYRLSLQQNANKSGTK